MVGPTTDLASLYADECSRLKRLLIRRGLSGSAAADAVQEAFVRLMRAPREDVRDLRSYLFRTAANLVADQYRQQYRDSKVIDPAADLDETVADPSQQPEAALVSAQELAALDDALSELPMRCREVLVLHKFEGLSYAEIAERLGISKNTVTVHMTKAMNTLRKRMRNVSLPDR